MVIDFHHHLVNEKGYVARLLREMDRVGIDMICVSALGELFADMWLMGERSEPFVDNASVARAVRDHPDRVVGMGFVRPGVDEAGRIDELGDQGFLGIKMSIPTRNYDDPSFFPLYERAQARCMPILFHMGVLTMPEPKPGEGISSAKMQPIMLDTIANEFPDLKMVIAHLGTESHEQAAALARILPNIYVDLSGKVTGWRSSKSIDFFKEAFYWQDAHEKVLFGSDVHVSELKLTYEDQRRIFSGIGWTTGQQNAVFGGNAAALLGLTPDGSSAHAD